MLSGFLAKDDPLVAGKGLHRGQATRVDVGIEPADPVQDAVAGKVGPLHGERVTVKQINEMREFLRHEGAQVLICPEAVFPVRIEALPAFRIPFLGRNGSATPCLVNDAGNAAGTLKCHFCKSVFSKTMDASPVLKSAMPQI